MNMNILKIAPLLLLLSGCSILQPMPSGRSAQAPTADQTRLAGALRNYRLPDRSIPPTPHPDPAVDAAIRSMFTVAENQQLIFDGSRAAEGDVIVGRMGHTDRMLLGLNVYPLSGQVAFRDVTDWKLADMSEGTRMRQRFLNALK